MLGVPSVASVTMGSALGLVAATAIGAAPNSTIPTAPMAAERPHQVGGG